MKQLQQIPESTYRQLTDQGLLEVEGSFHEIIKLLEGFHSFRQKYICYYQINDPMKLAVIVLASLTVAGGHQTIDIFLVLSILIVFAWAVILLGTYFTGKLIPDISKDYEETALPVLRYLSAKLGYQTEVAFRIWLNPVNSSNSKQTLDSGAGSSLFFAFQNRNSTSQQRQCIQLAVPLGNERTMLISVDEILQKTADYNDSLFSGTRRRASRMVSRYLEVNTSVVFPDTENTEVLEELKKKVKNDLFFLRTKYKPIKMGYVYNDTVSRRASLGADKIIEDIDNLLEHLNSLD